MGIDFLGESGNFLKTVISKAQAHILRVQKSGILLCQGIVGFLEDAEEFIASESVQFHAQGKTALQFGNKVTGLAEMECPGRDEQDVVGVHDTVLGVDRTALDNGQKVALHALAGHIGAAILAR